MNNRLASRRWVVASLLAATSASAQAADAFANDSLQDSPNRFGLSYRMGFNISAKFKNLGGFPALTDPGPATAGADHTYDDGYNRVDSSGNQGVAPNTTWYWGYQDASQVPGDGFIYFHSSQSAATVEAEETSDIQHGLELTYNRRLGRLGRGGWGLEAAFNFTFLDISDSGALYGTTDRITDKYSLTVNNQVVVPPQAPYAGPYVGPGPVISDVPIRTMETIPGGTLVDGERAFEADVYGFRVGPYAAFPLSRRLSVSLSGGLAAAYIDSTLSGSQSVQIPGAGSTPWVSGSDSANDWQLGAYAAARLSYAFSRRVDAAVGVQYQYLGTYNHKAGGWEAEVDLGESIFVTVGVGISF
jgi:hypothetical protein